MELRTNSDLQAGSRGLQCKGTFEFKFVCIPVIQYKQLFRVSPTIARSMIRRPAVPQQAVAEAPQAARKKDKPDPTPVPIKAGPAGSNCYFTSYPIFSLVTDGQGLLITGGGGGGRAYGVINYLQAHVAIQNAANRALTLETIATLDTGADAPLALDFLNAQGGVWGCALGGNCLLFKFNDDTLTIEPLFKWKSETGGNNLHVTNFIKLMAHGDTLHALTGGEDKVARLWKIVQMAGPGSKITSVLVVKEFPDHNAEVSDGDWHPSGSQFLTCGKDGTVKVWSMASLGIVATIQPRSIDKKLSNETLAIRSAYFLSKTSSDVVILCHHPRGPAFLMLYSLANPGAPISVVLASRTITPSMGINSARDKVVVSHAGGEKDIYALPSLRTVSRMTKHSHEMPPGNSVFVLEDLVVSGSPDFSLNFFDPKQRSGLSILTLLLVLIMLLFAAVAVVIMYVPEGKALLVQHVPGLKNLHPRFEEL